MSNPTTHVEQFNGSLGAFTGVDPIRYDGGLWLEEGTTNLIKNPGAETDAANWFNYGGPDSQVSRVTADAFIGSASFLVSISAADASPGVFAQGHVVGGGTTPRVFSGQLAVKDASVSSILVAHTRVYANGYGAVRDGGNFVITPPTDWQAIALDPVTTQNGDAIDEVRIDLFSGGGDITFRADAAQIEEKPYITSYSDSTLGTGYTLNGDGTSTRAASSAAIDPAGILSPTTGALAFRLTPTIETGLEEIWGECGTKGTGTDHIQWGRDATKHPFIEWSSNDAAYQRLTASETIDAGTQAFIYLGHDGTAIALQVDAGSLQSDTRDAVEDDFSTGDLTLQASAGGVIYDDFATFDRTLTATEIAQVRRAGSFSLGMFDGNPYIHFQLRPY